MFYQFADRTLAPEEKDFVAKELTSIWGQYRLRWEDRNNRMSTMDRVVTGDWDLRTEDGDRLEVGSPNVIHVALQDTAAASTITPTVRVPPSKPFAKERDQAGKMENLGQSYLSRSNFPILSHRSYLNLYGYGLFSTVAVMDEKEGPALEWRDPRTCFPENDFSSLGSVNRCFFARSMYLSQLPEEWQYEIANWFGRRNIDPLKKNINGRAVVDQTVTLLEWYDNDVIIKAAAWNAQQLNSMLSPADDGTTYVTCLLSVEEQPLKMCPVFIGQLQTLDGEPRGLYDQVVDVLKSHIRLQSLVLDYADQAVYNELWVRDPIGDVATGGGAVIKLGPNGAIGRVPPAVSALSVYQEMGGLLDSVHMGGRWPKARAGEIDQSIGSGKFVESMVSVQNTAIREGHTAMKHVLDQALPLLFKMDKQFGPARVVAGVRGNKRFLYERIADDIDLEAKPQAEFGMGLGRDPTQALVMGIQAYQAGLVSLEFVQENLDGVGDVQLEQVRIDRQNFQKLLEGKLALGMQDGSLDAEMIIDMARGREKGENLFELYEKYIIKPQKKQQEAMLNSTLGGMMQPGMQPPTGGPQAPPAPAPEDLLGGLLGGAPEPPQQISRLSVPLGNGSFAGSQIGG